jgi:hypothetical protein
MTDEIAIRFDFAEINRLHNVLAAAGKSANQAIRRAVNHTGDKARTAVTRELASQTGLKYGLMKRALKVSRASDGGPSGFVEGKGSLEYVIKAKGGNVGLKYFKPTERGSGVYASPWGEKKFFPGAFKKSGPTGHRRINPKFHGRVLRNAEGGKWGGKMTEVKSGVFIAGEMVRGQTAAAFYHIVERDLQARLEHELMRVLGK